MNDPHVVSLLYRLSEQSNKLYVDPPKVELETDGFSLVLADGVLTARMKNHHATVQAAREAVEPFLRAWEIDAGLECGRGSLEFTFDPPAEIVDRRPPPPGENRIYLATGNFTVGVNCAATVTVTRRAYPTPTKGFMASPDVQTMWFRYGLYLDGKEPLLSMAYVCLTLLERSTGATKDRHAAVCSMYAIDPIVRKQFGDIVSDHGGPSEARKLGGTATMTPLTEREKEWVEAVVKALIRRKAEYDADPSAPLPQITVADFPPLG